MKALIVSLVCGTVLLAQPTAPPKSAPAAPSLMNPASLKAKAPDNFKVKFTTTHGDFVVEVHRDWSPIGADRFYNLIRNHFFNDAAFFRIVPKFIVQFGMAADPKVGAVWQDATIKDDPMKPGITNKRGTLVFAKTGAPNSRTTQLFINLGNNTQSLDPQGFSPFAEVLEGMEVVDGLYAGYNELPQQDRILAQGKAYLDKNFPKLDAVKTATILPAEGAAPPPPSKAAPSASKGTASKAPVKK